MKIAFAKPINSELGWSLELLADYHPTANLPCKEGGVSLNLQAWKRRPPTKAELPRYQHALLVVGGMSERRHIARKAGFVEARLHVNRKGQFAYILAD